MRTDNLRPIVWLIWGRRQMKSSRGLWNIVGTLRGSRMKNPWNRLVDDVGGIQKLLSKLTDEFFSNFNTDEDVELLPLSEQVWDFHVSPEVVYDYLSRLHCRKATGPDNIPPRLLKLGAQFLCFPLAVIFNHSVRTATFPMCFKRAYVCPIPKSSCPSIRDFRPISLLSPLSKVFERIVLGHVKDKLFSCYGPHQHAYRPLSSTTTALIELSEHVTRALDCKDTTHVNIFCLDLSRAFDKLQHHRLLNFLNGCGLNHGFLRWLLCYLSSRSMCVKVLHNLGPCVTIPSGVPQGSILGPFLFAAFMGSVKFHGIEISIKYADDVIIIESLSGGQVSSVTLRDCVSTFDQKGLVVNPSKCKWLCLRRSKVCNLSVEPGFTQVDSLKILGCIFTNNLDWSMHISVILKLASQRLHIIRCLKDYLTPTELIRIYHAIITSLFVYAAPVYGNLNSTLSTKLERFQRRAHRLICGPTPCTCNRFPTLRSRFEDAAVQLLLCSEGNKDHPLHEYVPERLPLTSKFRMPVCATTRRLNSFFPWASHFNNSR